MAASNRSAIITKLIAVSTARALTKQYFDMVGGKDTENSHWVQNLF